MLKIHSHPQKDSYTNWLTEAVPIDFQVHWRPGNNGTNSLAPGLAHTHIQVQAPWYAELPAGDITLPIVFKMFCTDGAFVDAWATFQGDAGEKTINDSQGRSRLAVAAPAYPYHIPGDPNGLVTIPASLTFNFVDGLDVGCSPHGWARVSVSCRIQYTNGDAVTAKAMLSFYSMVDPSAPETPLGEPGINYAVHGAVTSARDGTQAFQTQLTEFKKLMPFLAPIAVPQKTEVGGYNYAPYLPLFPLTKYEMLIDPDFHMGVPGTVQPTLQVSPTGNLDTWLPATIAKSPPPMGFPPNQHRLGFSWLVDTGSGFSTPDGPMSAGERLVTLLTFPVTIGANPTDDLSQTVDWTGGVTPQPPPQEPLTVHVPQSITVISPDGQPVAVNWADHQTTGGTPPYVETCTPESGSMFPVGSTIVTCRSTDSTGQTVSATFSVLITVPPPAPWVDTTAQFQRSGDAVRVLFPDGKVVNLPNAVTP
jgi:hypothetical protein